ncbi:MAG: dCMP deaminase family protein [Candidatus Adiutrix sp.]|jgi:dCMP deaminase|nr:dCMP deaminase family protein [Candidatus Adiutrix sp.]
MPDNSFSGPDGRPDWDEYFMRLAELAATRSTCLRRQVGAVLVADRRVLATGYNGAPRGLAHCRETGCLREQQNIPSGQRHEICRAIHAEQNAILQAAQYGVAVKNATMYITNQPCAICARLIINLDVLRIIHRQAYPDDFALTLMREAGFTLADRDSLMVWTRS